MTEKKNIEDKLLPRLRFLGFVLLGFSLVAAFWDLLPQWEEEELYLEQALTQELSESPPLSPYLVATAFALIGSACVLLAWRKNHANAAKDFDR